MTSRTAKRLGLVSAILIACGATRTARGWSSLGTKPNQEDKKRIQQSLHYDKETE